MKKPNKVIRVLMLDDDNDMLEAITLNREYSTENIRIEIEFNKVHVKLENKDGKPNFSDSTVEKIAELSRKPFNIIISDMVYILDSDRNMDLKSKLESDNSLDVYTEITESENYLLPFGFTENILKDKVLNESFKENFINHHGDFLIYTFSPKPFSEFVSVVNCQKITNKLESKFKFATIKPPILIHNYIDVELSDKKKHKHGIALLIQELVQHKLTSYVTKEAIESLKNFRFDNSKKAFKKIIGFGIGIGVATPFIGEICYILFHHGLDLFEKERLSAILNFFVAVAIAVSFYIALSWFGVWYAKSIEINLSSKDNYEK